MSEEIKCSEIFKVGQLRMANFKSQLARMEKRFTKHEIDVFLRDAVGEKKFHQWGEADFDKISEVFNLALTVPDKKKKDLLAMANIKIHQKAVR